MKEETKNIKIQGSGTLYDALQNMGITPPHEVEFVKRTSRWKGTGYNNYFYKNETQDLYIEIERNNGGGQAPFWDDVKVSEWSEYANKNKTYAKMVGMECRLHNIPFEVGLAIGVEGVITLASEIGKRRTELKDFASTYRHELTNCGIGRRKTAMAAVLGQQLYAELKVDFMGQKNSQKLAEFLTEI